MGTILAFITSFLSSKLGPPVFMVIGAVAALGWGLWYMEDQAHNQTMIDASAAITKANGEIEKAASANDSLKLANNELEKAAIQNQVNQKIEQYEKAMLIKERDYANAKYDSYRARMSNVMDKKGSLISRMANNATNSLILQLEAATCRAGCDTEGNNEDSAEPSADTPAN